MIVLLKKQRFENVSLALASVFSFQFKYFTDPFFMMRKLFRISASSHKTKTVNSTTMRNTNITSK